MKVDFTKVFEKQVSDLRDEKLLMEIATCVDEARKADSLSEIPCEKIKRLQNRVPNKNQKL